MQQAGQLQQRCVRAATPPASRSTRSVPAAVLQLPAHQRQHGQPPCAALTNAAPDATSQQPTRSQLLRHGLALPATAALFAAAAPAAAPQAAWAAKAPSIISVLRDDPSGRSILTTATGAVLCDVLLTSA